MRFKFIIILIMFTLPSNTANLMAQDLVIKMTDGTENTCQLDVLQTIIFSNGSLLIKSSGQTDSYELLSIDKLYFGSLTDATINTELSNTIFYPNPVSNLLHIQNIKEDNSSLIIYRIDGKVEISKTVSSTETTIDLSRLAKGTYILKINDQTHKFIKL